MSSTIQDLAEAAEINAERMREKIESADDVRTELAIRGFTRERNTAALMGASRNGSALLEGRAVNAVVTFFEGRYDVTFYDVEV